MSMFASLLLLLTALAIPLVIVGVETAAGIRAKHTPSTQPVIPPAEAFEVLVPIYGSVSYLENVNYLASYGARVLLCTTTGETPEFYEQLRQLAIAHCFRIFYGAVQGRSSGTRRSTMGTTRDRLIRDALSQVGSPYVVCLDADTVTERPIGELVGALVAGGWDLCSVRLVPSNVRGWLTQLQAHEYRLSMAMRRIAPWMISGACHAARTEALRDVMGRHSLFFQGNDVETGLIAEKLGFRVGHVPFAVPTAVPATLRSWFRQRLAWSGGEFRLFIINAKIIRAHPVLWTYGALVVIIGVPLRWESLLWTAWVIPFVLAAYVAVMTYLNWQHRNGWLLALPIYAAVTGLILTPLGLYSYVRMAAQSRNLGIISARIGPS
jgi:hypothetical protein